MKKLLSFLFLVLLFYSLTPFLLVNAGLPPIEGACCFSDGTCMEEVVDECLTLGGDYQGDGTNCDPNLCPQPIGACCLPGDSCSELTEAECTASDGTYNGDGTMCDPVLCDFTPPLVDCIETVNPHGRKVPPAGSTTLPGPRGGQNEDGFYELFAMDIVDPDIFVEDSGSGAIFGPFSSGDKIKYTEAPGATPTIRAIGSTKPNNRGRSDAIAAHIIGNGDPMVTAVDLAGNTSSTLCLVPPPPK